MQSHSTKRLKTLVVDDEQANVRLLVRMLAQAGYANVNGATDPRQALLLCETWQPDLIILDLMMPHMDGLEFMAQLTSRQPPETYLPILMITADNSPQTKQRALAAGVNDFLTKPFDAIEVQLRVANLLHTRSLHLLLQNQNEILKERVREQTQGLEQRLRELSALNQLFRNHLSERFAVVESYGELIGGLARLSQELESLVQRARATPIPDLTEVRRLQEGPSGSA